MLFRPSRRQIIAGMAALGTVAAAPVRNAFAQAPKRIPIPEGEFTPQPIAISNFVAGTPGDAEVGVGVSQVITNNLKRSGLFAPIDPAAFIERIIDPDSPPQFQSWKQIGAHVSGDRPDDPAGRRPSESRIPALGRQHPAADGRPAILDLTGILAADRPHHLRPDLRTADQREGLFRQPRRVRRRDRVQGAPRQAAGADGSGRRQCQISDQGRRSGADAAVLAVDPGNHLYGIRPGRSARLSVQRRDRTARDRRQFSRHVVFAAVLAGRPAHHHEPAAGRQLEPVRDGFALEIDDAADRHAGDRHLAVLFARRLRICFESDRGGKPQIT